MVTDNQSAELQTSEKLTDDGTYYLREKARIQRTRKKLPPTVNRSVYNMHVPCSKTAYVQDEHQIRQSTFLVKLSEEKEHFQEIFTRDYMSHICLNCQTR